MTFSIVGRCAETGQLGIAISSSSIAVGARCPWLRAGTGAVATQNITLPALGPQILDRLDQGLAPGEALDQALSSNGYGQYRQVTVIDQHGRTALFTGREALGVHHARAGEQCVPRWPLVAKPGRCIRRRCRWSATCSGRWSTCASTGPSTTPSASSSDCGSPTSRRCRTM